MARAKHRPARTGAREPATSLRLIGGEWRSRRVPIADRPGLRPTPDRVRETLFNWLAPRLAGAACADLFAGTGALGLEALSRGAASSLFVESDDLAARAIDHALTTLSAGSRGRVMRGDATRADALVAPASLDIVFIDPPFAAQLHGAALAGIAVALKPEARIYLEYPLAEAQAIAERLAPNFELLKQSRAGSVGFCLAAPCPAPTEVAS
ncbi:16S rRNA (guanine(966)-N(2))-methyltransferase RsmD [uncultured Salinisphaera sp.]|uniref:16S rRNA (guanine(966)-N(2))-methyltransferase RsmD n=1 Tax=uncultured Salinisphaera sp. TaxID=359372 RepID=UPI0032B28628|tara:strand:+ start:7477 stop:8106 length:630 start_codon:yes stop_codon:yes gene_type:complete